MKVCTKCKESKELIDFHKKGNGYQAQCKVCRTAYDREQYRTNLIQRAARKASVANYKKQFRVWYNSLKTKPCSDCGVEYHHAAMQWDHIPGQEKVSSLAQLIHTGSKPKVLAEIAKCELVCANCHAVRTYHRLREGSDVESTATKDA